MQSDEEARKSDLFYSGGDYLYYKATWFSKLIPLRWYGYFPWRWDRKLERRSEKLTYF